MLVLAGVCRAGYWLWQNLVEDPRLEKLGKGRADDKCACCRGSESYLHIAWPGPYGSAQLHVLVPAPSGQKYNAIKKLPDIAFTGVGGIQTQFGDMNLFYVNDRSLSGAGRHMHARKYLPG